MSREMADLPEHGRGFTGPRGQPVAEPRLDKYASAPVHQLCIIPLVAIGLTMSCNRAESRQSQRIAARDSTGKAESPPAPARSALAGERVEIPSGALLVGSKPGTLGRQPSYEPALYSIELGGFEIDRLPYPNDPTRPVLTGVDREEARKLCASAGSRLCTELEWERACKGPDNASYSTGAHFNANCLSGPEKCKSGFDVLAMGITHREWTASDLGNSNESLAIARGAPADSADEAHRCGARRPLRPSANDKDLAFRCCRGAPNAAQVKEPTLGKAYQKAALSSQQLVEILRSQSISKAFAESAQLFREPDAADTVVERGSGDKKGLTFSVAPVLWNPSVGVQFLLLVGHAKDTSFIFAYNVIAKDQYELAASFVMKNEPGPVALAFDDSIRTRLFFSTCWGCPGETGKILFREPESAAILQP